MSSNEVWQDQERTTETIAKVEPGTTGWWMTYESGWSFFCLDYPEGPPNVGDLAVQWGDGIGRPVRGLAVSGHVVFYRTAAEDKANHARRVEEDKAKKREEFERDCEQIDARVSALPKCFQDRLERFRQNNPDFRWEYEGYELFCCEEAVKIADALGSCEAVAEFSGKSYDEQVKQLPTISDEHSGNTFGMACRLAHDYLLDQDRVRQRHGALAPLVGSKEYGCVPKEPA